jgi:hypothetical protein
LLSLVLIQQDDLTQQNRTQGEQLAALQPFDRHLPTPCKDVDASSKTLTASEGHFTMRESIGRVQSRARAGGGLP